jgi:acetyl esterase/lipase
MAARVHTQFIVRDPAFIRMTAKKVRIRIATIRTLIAILILAAVATSLRARSSEVTVEKNITYAPSGQQLDVCMPTGARKKTSLLLVHGGGFTGGSRKDLRGICKLFADGGFVVTTIDYRLAPDFPFPAAIDDARAALRWQRTRAQVFGIDPTKVVLLGYSAGATIVLDVGLDGESNPAGIIAVAGISDFDVMAKTTPHIQLRADIAAFLGRVSAASASPISLVSRDDPATYLFHGDADTFVPVAQSVLIAQRLKTEGVPLLLRVIPGGGHDILYKKPHIRTVLTDITNILLAYEAR